MDNKEPTPLVEAGRKHLTLLTMFNEVWISFSEQLLNYEEEFLHSLRKLHHLRIRILWVAVLPIPGIPGET